MKLYACDGCGNLVYFENTRCEACGRALGYRAADRRLIALDAHEAGLVPVGGDAPVVFCANTVHGVCNWLCDDGVDGGFCACCRHNRTVPDLGDPRNVELWGKLEAAKHRLFDTLIALDLPRPTKAEDPVAGLAFDILDAAAPALEPVMTGHADGVITIALHEADDAVRERTRIELGEPYRSLLGHFRHEIAHYYFDRLVAADPVEIEAFRALFGDERADYGAALQAHYATGAPPDWQQRHVSAYATAHPWEDFAETFAHYLHIIDTLETAHAFGLAVRPRVATIAGLATRIDVEPGDMRSIEGMIARWLPLTYAVNSLNRSMGQPDLYPFLLAPAAIDKLGYVHRLMRAQRDREPDAPPARS